jgi:hypothetical protein
MSNVIKHAGWEIPFSDDQIAQLEEDEAIQLVDWEGSEAIYMLTDQWIEACRQWNAHPLESCMIILAFHREDL